MFYLYKTLYNQWQDTQLLLVWPNSCVHQSILIVQLVEGVQTLNQLGNIPFSCAFVYVELI